MKDFLHEVRWLEGHSVFPIHETSVGIPKDFHHQGIAEKTKVIEV